MSNIRLSDVLNREPMRGIPSGASINLTGTGTTNIINVTGERGVLKSVGVRIGTAVTGTPTVTLNVTIDGSTVLTFNMYTAGLLLGDNAAGYARNANTGGGANFSQIGNVWLAELNLPYNSSCLVTVIVTGGASAGVWAVSGLRSVPA